MMAVLGVAIGCNGDDVAEDGGAAEGSTGSDPGDTSAETSTGPGDTGPGDSGSQDSGSADEGSSGDGSDGASTGDPSLPPPPTSIEEAVAIYGSAWNELDADRRLALLELAWADEGIYRDPTVLAEGRDALVEAIGSFHDSFPGSQLELTTEVDAYDGHLRFDWTITGTAALPGVDVGVIGDDFRLLAITGFFGPLPSGTPIPEPVGALVDAWAEEDATARAALLDAAVTDDFVLRQPGLELSDRDALDEHLASSTMTLVGTPDAYDSVMRFGFTTSDGEGLAMATVGDDGRLAELTMFFD